MNRGASLPLTRIGGLAVLLTVAAAFTGAAFFSVPAGPAELFAYRLLLLFLLGFWVLVVVFTPAPLFPAHMRPVQLSLLFLGLWVAYAIVNLLPVIDPGAYIRHVVLLFMGVLLVFFIVYFCSSERWLVRLYGLWGGMVLLLLGLGVWQAWTGQQLAISMHADAAGAERFTPMGTFPRVNQYAATLALSAPLFLALLATARRISVGFLAGAALAVILVLIYLTGSRVSLLAVMLQGLLVWGLFLSGRRRWAGVIGVGLILGLVYVFAQQHLAEVVSVIIERFAGALEQVLQDRGSGGIRFNLALNGLVFLRDSMGLGIGAGNFNAYIEAFGRHPTLHAGWHEFSQITYPHNWWIELLAEYGLWVFAGFVVFFVSLTWRIAHLACRLADPRQRMIGQALTLALVSYPLIALAPGYFLAFRPQWVLLGLALAFVVTHAHRDDSSNAPEK